MSDAARRQNPCGGAGGRGRGGAGASLLHGAAAIRADGCARPVLIAAALSLIDLESLRLFYRIDRTEALLSLLSLSASSPSARWTPFCSPWR